MTDKILTIYDTQLLTATVTNDISNKRICKIAISDIQAEDIGALILDLQQVETLLALYGYQG